MKKLVLVGDSIRMGYQAYVKNELFGLQNKTVVIVLTSRNTLISG